MSLSFLDRERSIAAPGFSRWLVPPAALAIHLSIGQVYAFSVFKNPLLALHAADGTAWSLKEVGYIFSIAIAVLGLSAALFGAWLERVGPRRAMFYAALCFGLGFEIASFGAGKPLPGADLSRLWSRRWHRSRPGLHFAGVDADQVVPGPPRTFDRTRHHGLRRRCAHWSSAGQQPDGSTSRPTATRIPSPSPGSRWEFSTSSS